MRTLIGLLAILLIGCATQSAGPMTAEQATQAARANTEIAIHHLRNDNLQLSVRKVERALEQDPNLIQAHLVAASVQSRLGITETAEAHYRQALAIDREHGPTLNNYANFLCQNNRLARAIDLWEMAAGNPLYTGQAMALSNAGQCLHQAGQYDRARAYWRRSLNESADYSPALLALAKDSLRRDALNAASNYYSRYTGVATASAHGLWLGAQIARAQGDEARYAERIERLQNAFPASKQAAQLNE